MENAENSRITAAVGRSGRGRSASAKSNSSLTSRESTACREEARTQTMFSESCSVLPETEVAVYRIAASSAKSHNVCYSTVIFLRIYISVDI